MDVKVNLEEHLNKEIYVEVPSYVENIEDYVYKIVKRMYINGDIVLTKINAQRKIRHLNILDDTFYLKAVFVQI